MFVRLRVWQLAFGLWGLQVSLVLMGARHGIKRLLNHRIDLLGEVGLLTAFESLIVPLASLNVAVILFHAAMLRLFSPHFLHYAFAFFAYAIGFVFVYYPQGLEPLLLPSKIPAFLEIIRQPALVWTLGTLFILVLARPLISVWRSTHKSVFTFKLKLQCLALTGLTIHIFFLNNPYLSLPFRGSIRQSNAPAHNSMSPTTPHILIIGIDGLRPEALDDILDSGHYPAIERFRRQSVVFENASTNLARTHPTYHSIFHGRPIQNLQLRLTDHPASINTESSLSNSWIHRLASRGYRTQIELSDTSFSYYKKSSFLDSPPRQRPGSDQSVWPHLYFDPITWGWLNNSIGELLGPRIVGNGAYHIYYWPQRFKTRITNELSRWSEATPRFSTFHLVKLHWPGANQYPYVTRRERSAPLSSQFGYDHSFQITHRGQPLQSDRKRNEAIYKDGVRQLADQFLEPLIEELEQLGRFKDTHIVLMSDHGESFYDDSLIPIHKMPGHGSLVGWSEDSHHSLLWIHAPHQEGKVIKEDFALYNILNYILQPERQDLMGQPVHIETDRWFAKLYPGQQLAQAARMAPNEVQFVEGQLLLREEAVRRHIFEKKRGVAHQGEVIFWWPSVYGYYSNSVIPRGVSNFKFHPSKVFSGDQSQGVFPELSSPQSKLIGKNWNIMRSHVPSKIGPETDIGWIEFQIASETLFADFAPLKSVRALTKLASHRSDPSLRNVARMRIWEACRLFPWKFTIADFQWLKPVMDSTEKLAQLWCELRIASWSEVPRRHTISPESFLIDLNWNRTSLSFTDLDLREAQGAELKRLILESESIQVAELAAAMISDEPGLSHIPRADLSAMLFSDTATGIAPIVKEQSRQNLPQPDLGSEFAQLSRLALVPLKTGDMEHSPPLGSAVRDPLLYLDELMKLAKQSRSYGMIGLLDPWYARLARNYRTRGSDFRRLAFSRILSLDESASTPTLLALPEIVWPPDEAKVVILGIGEKWENLPGPKSDQLDIRLWWRDQLIEAMRPKPKI
jgi:arylsulfatase A-like enzyme